MGTTTWREIDGVPEHQTVEKTHLDGGAPLRLRLTLLVALCAQLRLPLAPSQQPTLAAPLWRDVKFPSGSCPTILVLRPDERQPPQD